MAKRKRQKAPEPPKATRRVSDTVLMRVLDEHMRESLSDLADIYQRLLTALGAKVMQWKEYIKIQSSSNANDRAVISAGILAQWNLACQKRKLDPRSVMLVIRDGASLSSVMRALRMKRACVEAQLRACLTVWSAYRKRCGPAEITIHVKAARTCCGRRRHKLNRPLQAT